MPILAARLSTHETEAYMNSSAQSKTSPGMTHSAVNRVADMAGRKVADLAMQKVLPALQNMNNNTKKVLTVAALAGIGFMIIRGLNRDEIEI
jgi:hypothetical protein